MIFGMTKYSDCPYFSSANLKDLWQQRPCEMLSLDKSDDIVRATFEKAFHNPPKLLLKSSSVDRSLSKNWGVFANENLNLGTGLIPFVGQYDDSSYSVKYLADLLSGKLMPQPYRFKKFNAEKIGNVSRFFNEGFPNCCVEEISNYQGLTNHHMLVIIEETGVKEGEELLWDYGQGEVRLKWNSVYQIPNPEAMREVGVIESQGKVREWELRSIYYSIVTMEASICVR